MSATRVLLAAASLALLLSACKRTPKETAAADREERQTPVAEIAPVVAPVVAAPEKLPMRGDDGRDSWGYPNRFVDRALLRRLLRDRRFDDLTRYFEEVQTRFEADSRFEYWPMDAGDAFSTNEAELAAGLDQWVAASSASFAPYLARGTYWVSVGYAQRGGRYAADTHEDNFRAMNDALKKGLTDTAKAIELNPKVVAAMRIQLSALRAASNRAEIKTVLKRALAVCPECFQIRVIGMYAMQPRWGGSHQEMAEIAQSAPVDANPKLRLLPGYMELDRADALVDTKDFALGLEALHRAVSLGEHWEFYAERADMYVRLEEYGSARRDIDRAIALRPNYPRSYFVRADLERANKEYEAAGRDLLTGLQMDPTDSRARRIFADVVQGVVYQGCEYQKAGRKEDALRLFDLALELDPSNGLAHQRRLQALTGEQPAAPQPAASQEAVNTPAASDDFRVNQELDLKLGQQGRFEEVLAMWNEYLAKHPDDGRAYLERGGTNHRLGKEAESYADAKKACDLGVAQGCFFAKRMSGGK